MKLNALDFYSKMIILAFTEQEYSFHELFMNDDYSFSGYVT